MNSIAASIEIRTLLAKQCRCGEVLGERIASESFACILNRDGMEILE